jgi:hypothetical protein
MDLDILKDQWQQHAQEETPVALEATAIMTIITRKAADIRQDVRRRLRREATYYLPTLAVTVTLFLDGVTPVRLGFAAGMTVLLGGIAATLWIAQRRIAQTTLDGSVREVLTGLRSKIDAAARAYLAAYVVTFICSGALLVGIVWWRQGPGFAFVGTLACAALAACWSYWSGRAYVARLFQRDRSNVADCLRQLNAQEG